MQVQNKIIRKLISLSYDNVINDKEYLAKELFTQMIIYDGESIGEKRFSNRGYYHGKKFSRAAISVGCKTKYVSKRNGFVITKLPKDCIEYLDNIHFIQYDYYDQRLHTPTGLCGKSSSTVKYEDPRTGESVRGTKRSHFLICFDECPEIGEQVEKMFGKKRMIIAEEK